MMNILFLIRSFSSTRLWGSYPASWPQLHQTPLGWRRTLWEPDLITRVPDSCFCERNGSRSLLIFFHIPAPTTLSPSLLWTRELLVRTRRVSPHASRLRHVEMIVGCSTNETFHRIGTAFWKLSQHLFFSLPCFSALSPGLRAERWW